MGPEELERHRAACRKWYAKTRQYNIARVKAWNKANPGKHEVANKKYRAANREKVNERAREWHRNRRSFISVIKQKLRRNKRRSLERAAEGWFCPCDIRFIFRRQYGYCAYCDRSLENGFEIDHVIPLSKGGSNWRHNLALACADCNRRKKDKLGWVPSWHFFQV